MSHDILTPEEAATLKKLLDDHAVAALHNAETARKYGMDSQEFREADKQTNRIWVKIRDIQGLPGKD